MKTFFLSLATLFACLLQQGTLEAQAAPIETKAEFRDGVAYIRWAPTNPEAWLLANQNGYIIERQKLIPGQKSKPDAFQSLTQNPILPWTLEQFSAFQNDANASYILVEAECIHGSWRDAYAEGQNPKDWLEAADELNNKFSFALFAADMDFRAAESAGLAFVDQSVESGVQYLYRIYIADENNPLASNTARYFKLKMEETPAFQPQIFEVKEQEALISLHWNRANHARHFSAYWIEQSIDGQNFERLNSTPYVHALGTDERLQTDFISYTVPTPNNQTRYYRIIGITPFGQLSTPSEAVKATAQDRTPPQAAENIKTKAIDNQSIEITWDWTGSDSDLKGFHVIRTFDFKGTFHTISSEVLSPDTRLFIDQNANTVGTNYYQIVAIDDNENHSKSPVAAGFIEDKTPPVAPKGLSGEISETGIVKLNWEANPEKDIEGYQIYISNSPDDVFVNLSNKPQIANNFTDTLTLNTLTKPVYYKIAAIDKRGNYSTFSDMLYLERPDIIPPAPPVIQDFKAQATQIRISWAPSNSDDVAAQHLYRSIPGEPKIRLAELTPSIVEYTDKNLQPNQAYTYEITAVDQVELESKVAFSMTIYTKNQKLDLPSNLQALSDENQVTLQWQVPQSKGDILVYRSTNGGPFNTLKRLDTNHQSFIDQRPRQGNTYTYALRFVSADGQRSGMSERVEVEF